VNPDSKLGHYLRGERLDGALPSKLMFEIYDRNGFKEPGPNAKHCRLQIRPRPDS
jgi:hypothetical protein